MKKEINYEQALRRLTDIVQQMEHNELDIDQLTAQLKEAKSLISLCKDKLTKTDEEIRKILTEETKE